MSAQDATPRVNRTGLGVAPGMAEDLVLGARLSAPSSDGDAQQIAEIRIGYAAQAEPLGSVPESLAEDGSLRDSEESPNPVLIDKLGERIAFERAAVRWYDALLSKFDAFGSWPEGPQRAQLEQIRQAECEHFAMLGAAIAELDGDPTALTPSADLHMVACQGLRAVLTDPRVDLRRSLEAILMAELADNDAWQNLSDLACALGHDALARDCDAALRQERDHLRQVRDWLGSGLSVAATGELQPAFVLRASERVGQAGHVEVAAGGRASDPDSRPARRSGIAVKRTAKKKAPARGGKRRAKPAPKKKPARRKARSS